MQSHSPSSDRSRPRSRRSHSQSLPSWRQHDDDDELRELRQEAARLRRERDEARHDRDRALQDLEDQERESARLRRERDDAERDLDHEMRVSERLRRQRDEQARENDRLRGFEGRSAPRRERVSKGDERWPRAPRFVIAGDSSVDGTDWDTWYDDARRYAHSQEDEGPGRGRGELMSDEAALGDSNDSSYGTDVGIDAETSDAEVDGGDDGAEQSDDWMDGGWFAELLAGDAA